MGAIYSNIEICKTGQLSEWKLKRLFNSKNLKFLLGLRQRIKLFFIKEVEQLAIIKHEGLKVISITLPKNQFGTFTGCSWTVPFDSPVEQARLRYKVFIPKDFDFVKGGKLPGLAGGSANTGGHNPNGLDGWSVRFMFKEQGTLSAYLYHAGMATDYGEHAYLTYNNSPILLEYGVWNTIELSIKMNSPDQPNGEVRCSLNQKEGLNLQNIYFRKISELKIDQLLFSCFMGGDDASYAPLSDQFLLFKDFLVEY